MRENLEIISNREEEQAQQERGINKFPEIFANEALPDTSLVYSVPVMGEWKNGNLPLSDNSNT